MVTESVTSPLHHTRTCPVFVFRRALLRDRPLLCQSMCAHPWEGPLFPVFSSKEGPVLLQRAASAVPHCHLLTPCLAGRGTLAFPPGLGSSAQPLLNPSQQKLRCSLSRINTQPAQLWGEKFLTTFWECGIGRQEADRLTAGFPPALSPG